MRKFRTKTSEQRLESIHICSSSPVAQIIQPLTRRHLVTPSLLQLNLVGKEEALSLLIHLLLPLLLHLALGRQLVVVIRISPLIQLFPLPR